VIAEFRIALAVSRGHGNPAPFHPAEEKRRGAHHFEQNESRFELLRPIADEVRPMTATGNELVQIAHHLAAVAHAKCESTVAREEGGELVAGARIEQDGLRPALARAQNVTVREDADR